MKYLGAIKNGTTKGIIITEILRNTTEITIEKLNEFKEHNTDAIIFAILGKTMVVAIANKKPMLRRMISITVKLKPKLLLSVVFIFANKQKVLLMCFQFSNHSKHHISHTHTKAQRHTDT